MPTYADPAELDTYASARDYSDRLPDGAPALNALLETAERDLDGAIGVGDRETNDTGLLVDPAADLEPRQAEALSRATCAQALYRIEMGPQHFVRAQRDKIAGRAFTSEGKLPVVGPEAMRELQHAGVFRLTTTTGERREGGARAFQRDLD